MTRKVHSLTGRITLPLMYKAFKAVKRNRGAAGVDKVSIQCFEANLDNNLIALMSALKTRRYQPLPLRRKYITKRNGKLRPLGIPTVKDRIAQEVVRQLLDPIFDPTFHPDSYGFRKGRNAHQAIARIRQLTADGYRVVADADIQRFFDEIPHKLIVDSVAQKVADGNILELVRKFLTSGVLEEGIRLPTRKGTPQGGVVSPLLANIVLDKLDRVLEAHGCKFVRYADDFVILCKTLPDAERALALVSETISPMGLTLHPDKTHITPLAAGFEFLGFSINHLGCKIRPQAIERLKDKIRATTIRCHNLDRSVITRLNQILRGTINYFVPKSHATGAAVFIRLDKWTRRRIRCMKYKRIYRTDNRRLLNKHIDRLGLLKMHELFHTAKGVS